MLYVARNLGSLLALGWNVRPINPFAFGDSSGAAVRFIYALCVPESFCSGCLAPQALQRHCRQRYALASNFA